MMVPALVLVIAMVPAFAVLICVKQRSAAAVSPVSIVLMTDLVALAGLVLLISFVRYRLADVEVVVATAHVDAGQVLDGDDLAIRRVNRDEADRAISDLTEATGRIAQDEMASGDVLTTTNTPERVVLELPASAVRANEPLTPGWVDVLTTPIRSETEPVVVEGALLEQTAGGGFALQTTSEDRGALLAVLGRSTVIIQSRED